MNLSKLTGPVIIAGIVCGFIFPFFKVFHAITTLLLGIIIFSACLNITIGSIVETIKKPSKHLILLSILFILQPIATWLIARQFIANPLLLAGIVIAAAGPTPSGLGFWIHSIKGNISLALAFVSVSHILTPLVLPAISYYLLGSYVSVDVIGIARSLAIVIIIPMVLALIVQNFKDIKKYTLYFSLPAYFLVTATIIALNSEIIFNGSNLLLITAFVLFQCIFSSSAAFLLSRNWGPRERESLILGVLGRNNILTIAVAISGFGALAALPCAVAIVVQLIIIAIYLHFKKDSE